VRATKPFIFDCYAETPKFDAASLSNDNGAATVGHATKSGHAKYYRGALYLGMVRMLSQLILCDIFVTIFHLPTKFLTRFVCISQGTGVAVHLSQSIAGSYSCGACYKE
jgi:hypothetical protein